MVVSAGERHVPFLAIVLISGVFVGVAAMMLYVATPPPMAPAVPARLVTSTPRVPPTPPAAQDPGHEWEGVEPAERINEQQMRQNQGLWDSRGANNLDRTLNSTQ